MPWSHCEATIPDDQVCPACGLTKANWTVAIDVTRTFKVSARRGAPTARFVVVDDSDETPLEGEPFEVELQDGSTVRGSLDEFGAGRVPSPGAGGEFTVRFPKLRGADLRAVTPEGAGAGTADEPLRLRFALAVRPTLRVERPLVLTFKRRGAPLASAPYRLVVGGAETSGSLDAEGTLRLAPAPTEGEGQVTVGEGADALVHRLAFGTLLPVSDPRGVRQRLKNLGLRAGATDEGDHGPATRGGLERLQRRHGLEPSGELCPDTRRRLLETHG